ncbi:UDP-N-acetylmuramoyl-L-alanyl-D-glutamate--2,6-diaminopimelate ligase [Clostridium saccharoperbutylacetonicum]|uniref:UDP-N-acetylmuramoyl-L-alanyl-D-glutamate--2,6-diaminopimelate ligase n=1 Tax=Clostridium saccharoperbutylacetonicum N1-4(HMT) TaxID=931276 RepID=M1MNU1_9CLOT|nr:UDP-N-acetylmuramoyl-L-alanyl-D-glutamate--2,6-diaminopimelate ligase [Clostridium saccharoperbutylacetonicum]AGF56391.1 UDP-N-acetylmuramoyl-L-alanyl-D-glutamate--2,6-diaminopimelate ligase MurE [Clostridium saccharoperbutylacetonicum N1-4(HMT)]NRT62865.1 UDP-N-acetylmuramoyl-L-alanyl-D-glutamate--2,6-diaminopimelate ligase [Clostridium saccharoperbutylacetonicum]NSB26220.1 UDP-N-acetylmuramoyl-L-alanyl-D-glutamate--2,6-diaminopimelate ligase [Clostridium saccharoperbutylacetonicum]NSB45573
MNFKSILVGIDYELIQGEIDVEINKINYDSRKINQLDVFVCVKGYATDGHNYINKALENGAKVIVVQDKVDIENKEVTIIKCEDTRKALALLGANYYDNPSSKMKIIGITGTNGKTTTAFMIKNILEANNKKVGLIGTIANYIGSEKIHTERTTPESLELQELFSDMVNRGVEYCVMEVSSHSLELDRVYGVKFEVGIFTNLTRDHLDFHKTFENYYKAKFKLFERAGIKIVNIDDNYGRQVIEDLENLKGKEVYTFSVNSNSDFKVFDEEMGSREIKFKLKLKKEEQFILNIPGEYNIYNALGAIIACYKLDIPEVAIKNGIESVVVLGRCERVAKEYNLPYEIIIDYAHTPDGLENILKTAKAFTKGKLISVFGCGGDRDKVKRPQMGKISTDIADISIITSDNPRSEEPAEIIKDIKAGVNKENYIIIGNRKEAIKKAITIADKDDVIVIAGKGHETYQILKDETIHFDEREVVKEILDSVNKS